MEDEIYSQESETVVDRDQEIPEFPDLQKTSETRSEGVEAEGEEVEISETGIPEIGTENVTRGIGTVSVGLSTETEVPPDENGIEASSGEVEWTEEETEEEGNPLSIIRQLERMTYKYKYIAVLLYFTHWLADLYEYK